MSVACLPSFQTYGRESRRRNFGEFAVSVGAHRGGHCIPAHRHADEYVWCLVLDGALEEVSGRYRTEASAGSFLVRPPDCVHANRFSSAPGLCLNLFPSRAWLSAHDLGLIGDTYIHQRAKSLLAIGREIVGELSESDSRAALAIEGLLLEALTRTARIDRFERDGRAPWLAAALDEIEANPAGELKLADLAHHCGVSTGHLARSFRATFGKSLGEFVRGRRLERTAEIIRASKRPLAEVAAAVGFCDQAHFSRAFRAHFNLTPATYAKQRRA